MHKRIPEPSQTARKIYNSVTFCSQRRLYSRECNKLTLKILPECSVGGLVLFLKLVTITRSLQSNHQILFVNGLFDTGLTFLFMYFSRCKNNSIIFFLTRFSPDKWNTIWEILKRNLLMYCLKRRSRFLYRLISIFFTQNLE